MQVTATFVNPPKNPGGKYGSIKATDGRYYSIEWARYGTVFRKGGTYDVEVSTAEQNGKTFYNITGLNTGPERAAGNGAAAAGGAPPPDRFWMPFVSNTVAHAIQNGLITEPTHIKVWAAAAKQAALELDKPANGRGEFDDDIPFA